MSLWPFLEGWVKTRPFGKVFFKVTSNWEVFFKVTARRLLFTWYCWWFRTPATAPLERFPTDPITERQTMIVGCIVIETKRKVFSFHETILRFGEPGSQGIGMLSHRVDTNPTGGTGLDRPINFEVIKPAKLDNRGNILSSGKPGWVGGIEWWAKKKPYF